jgi:predicted dinucleotide-binding enzyme
MKRIGIIGSGAIGAAVARLAVAADYEVMIANSRGPESLKDLVEELGSTALAADAAAAAEFGELTVLAVPLAAYPTLPLERLKGRIVLSTGNYYPGREGRIAVLDELESTTADYELTLLPGVRLAKAFNNIVAHHIPNLADSTPRTALPVAADDADAKAAAMQVVDDLGFEAVDAGSLAESWRFEPASGAYTPIYAASQDGFAADYLADPGAPLTAARLRELLAASHRPDVAGREY